MERFYEKLKEMPESKYNRLQKILGAVAGVLSWLALRAGNFSEDNLVGYLFLGVCLVVILGSRALSRKIERPVNKFQVSLAIGLGSCLLIFGLFTFILSPYVFTDGVQMGLIELIFDIPV